MNTKSLYLTGLALLSACIFALCSQAQITIDNDIPSGTIGHYRVDMEAGGETRTGYITAEQFATGTVTTDEIIFDYSSFIDRGNGAIRLSGSPITSGPTLTADDTVTSTGTFIGSNGNIINWRAVTHIPTRSSRLSSVFTFTATNGVLGEITLHQYLDEDVNSSVGNDILFLRGSVDRNDLELFTVDGPQTYGVAHGGRYRPSASLVNATFLGWAANAYPVLESAIIAGTAQVSLEGVINLNALPQFTDPVVGTAYGPNDITSTLAWKVDPNVTFATITTDMGGVPLARELRCVVDGVIWNDVGEDGILNDNLETNGINGVQLELIQGEEVYATTTTMPTTNVTIEGVIYEVVNGFYEFEDIPDGDYVIRVVEDSFPMNVFIESTTNNLSTVTVETGVRCPEVVFGYFDNSCTVTGFVWDDANENGTLDGSETPASSGLNGVPVQLMQGGQVVATSTTHSASNVVVEGQIQAVVDGYFDFPNVLGGSYTIAVDTNAHPFAFPVETTEQIGSTLVVNKDDGCAQFSVGFTRARCTASGVIWNDINRNGLRDGSEPLSGSGLNGVTVRLTQGGTVFTTTTARATNVIIGGTMVAVADGYFDFPDLIGGDYTIDVISNTIDLEGPLETTAVSGSVLSIDPLIGCPEVGLGFAASSCTITGAIWRDANRNGSLDGTEDLDGLGLNGVEVLLTLGNTVHSNRTRRATNVTVDGVFYPAIDGYFDLPGAAEGTYTLQVTEATLPLGSPFETTAINGTTITVDLTQPCPERLIGFAEQTCTVSGFVWRDTNRNGVLDGNERLDGHGLNGINLRLVQGANTFHATTLRATNVTVQGSVIAAADGTFEFLDVIDGNYTLVVDEATVPFGTPLETTALNGGSISIDPGAACPEFAMGYSEPGNCVLSGFVWQDVDGNGLTNEDLANFGLQNIPVTLRSISGTAPPVQTQTQLLTNDSGSQQGYYEFANLAPGTYTVEVDRSAIPLELDLFITANSPQPFEILSIAACPVVNFGFRASTVFGETTLQTTLINWTLDRQTGLLTSEVHIINPAGSGQQYTEPFQFVFDSALEGYLVTPAGTTETGRPYLDITAEVHAALALIGNGDLILDSGETVTVSGIGPFFSRTRRPLNDNARVVVATGRGAITLTDPDFQRGVISELTLASGTLTLELEGLTVDQWYDVVCIDTLADAPWILIDNFQATASEMQRVATVPTTAESRFYQVREQGVRSRQ